ncbi:TonB-dependent receptor plug domain-containing protein [Paracoccus albus]|uniref:TonB-dependent receptor plug domain-containing protein n=1 Tax=Paracoccus albus TaxID=3017784 RepID=UPI0022F07215|nr:TonB-dependent receptor plug domain-containing protein [Paracoccus albus]WBU62080.1 TonB-dependent receptor plug domain-containing protein [Paracoccus albus]
MRHRFCVRCALLGSVVFVTPLAALAQSGAEVIVLDEITLKSKRDVETQTANPVTNIDQQEIDDRQAGTIAELVDTVPGVTLVNGATPSGSGINIRGFGANGTYGTDQMVMIQVDGATQGSEELYRLGTQLYTDPSLYKTVSVSRGTVGSFEYGSGVVGGIVRLETKDASDFTGGVSGYKLRQTLEAASNGDGLTSSTILAWQPNDDLEILGQYVFRKMDEQTDGAGEDVGAEPFKLPSYMLKAKYTFGAARDQSVTLSYNDTQTSENDVPYDQFGLGGSSFGNVDRDVRTRTTVLEYEYDPSNPLIHIEANLSHADQKIDSTYIEGTSPYGPAAGSLGDADHRYETTKLTVKNTSRFQTGSAEHDLRLGAEIIRKKRAEAVSAPGGTDRRFALFAVDDITWGGFTISPAMRYETQKLRRQSDASGSNPQTEYDNDAIMGGISARYEWSNGFSAFASAAYTENLPILDDFDKDSFMNQSQKARVYEIGAAYDAVDVFSGGDTLSLKANLYQSDIWDVTSYSGVAEVEMRGLELEASYSVASGYYADMNATISKGDALGINGEETHWGNAPADSLYLTLGKRWGEKLDLSWEMLANARMDRVDRTNRETPGIGVHNLRATYRPQAGVLEGSEFRVGVENIFDKEYRPHLATRNGAGRNVKLTVAKTF